MKDKGKARQTRVPWYKRGRVVLLVGALTCGISATFIVAPFIPRDFYPSTWSLLISGICGIVAVVVNLKGD
jgi:hypothetical protein